MSQTILDDNGRALLDNHSAPFLVLNESRPARILLDGIHAGLGYHQKLGIPLDALRRWHAAYDVGTYEVLCFLAQLLDCPAILCTTSRRVIECNRVEDVPSQMDDVHDGVDIPGNKNLPEEERQWRFANLYYPYRHKSRDMIEDCAQRTGGAGLFLSIHSMSRRVHNTDSYGKRADDRVRPLCALLYDKSEPLAVAMKENFERRPFFEGMKESYLREVAERSSDGRPAYDIFEMNKPWDFKNPELSQGTVIDTGQQKMEAVTWEMRRDLLSDDHWNVDLKAAERMAREIAAAVVAARPALAPQRSIAEIEAMPLKAPKAMLEEAIAAAAV